MEGSLWFEAAYSHWGNNKPKTEGRILYSFYNIQVLAHVRGWHEILVIPKCSLFFFFCFYNFNELYLYLMMFCFSPFIFSSIFHPLSGLPPQYRSPTYVPTPQQFPVPTGTPGYYPGTSPAEYGTYGKRFYLESHLCHSPSNKHHSYTWQTKSVGETNNYEDRWYTL